MGCANITYSLPGAIAREGCDESTVLLAVGVDQETVETLALRLITIDVDVGKRRSELSDEPLDRQIILDGIHLGYLQIPAEKASAATSSSHGQDLLGVCPSHQIGHH